MSDAIPRRWKEHAGYLWFVMPIIIAIAATPSGAQHLNQHCVISVLNRSVVVNKYRSWILPNVPANFGLVRVRAMCVENGVTTFGQSDLFSIGANQTSACNDFQNATSVGACSPGTLAYPDHTIP